MDILVRGDSGFATPALYGLCDEFNCHFLIKLKGNHRLVTLAESQVSYDNQIDFSKAEVQQVELDYQVDTWSKPYRVVAQSVRPSNELLYRHEFVITNLNTVRPTDLFTTYHQRGVIENSIKEAKLGFFMDKTNSHSFLANTFRMLLSAVAYNIVQAFKQNVLPMEKRHCQITTLRWVAFHIPAIVIRHARRYILKLSSNNVFDEIYWSILAKIRCLT